MYKQLYSEDLQNFSANLGNKKKETVPINTDIEFDSGGGVIRALYCRKNGAVGEHEQGEPHLLQRDCWR